MSACYFIKQVLNWYPHSFYVQCTYYYTHTPSRQYSFQTNLKRQNIFMQAYCLINWRYVYLTDLIRWNTTLIMTNKYYSYVNIYLDTVNISTEYTQFSDVTNSWLRGARIYSHFFTKLSTRDLRSILHHNPLGTQYSDKVICKINLQQLLLIKFYLIVRSHILCIFEIQIWNIRSMGLWSRNS